MKPVRIQLSRRKGFSLHATSHAHNGLNVVSVARPGPFGNPFVVGRDGDRVECVRLFGLMLAGYLAVVATPSIADQRAARETILGRLDELRGKNLACWCRTDGKPCHADVLLELANS